VFPPDTPQEAVYDCTAKPLVLLLLQGFNATVLVYGQTGSGKTYTMSGTEAQPGIIRRANETLFATIREAERRLEFTLKASFFEIYNERITDLLEPSNQTLRIREDKYKGIYIPELTEAFIASAADLPAFHTRSNINCRIAQTHMGQCSSRAHSLVLLTVTHTSNVDFTAKTGKLWLVDLAGSERVSKTVATGARLQEAANINRSLSTLGTIILALTDGKSTHIPYRDSKLTRILQDSFGGNAHTTLILTCSPSSFNESETTSTLRFGTRAKCVINRPRINIDLTTSELQLMLARAEAEIRGRDEAIRQLKEKLAEARVECPVECEGKWRFGGIEDEVRAEMGIMRETIVDLRGENEKLRGKLRLQKEINVKLLREHEDCQPSIPIANLQGELLDQKPESSEQKEAPYGSSLVGGEGRQWRVKQQVQGGRSSLS
jgi:kinesin family protein 5